MSPLCIQAFLTALSLVHSLHISVSLVDSCLARPIIKVHQQAHIMVRVHMYYSSRISNAAYTTVKALVMRTSPTPNLRL